MSASLPPRPGRPRVVVVTGLSGAGKSTALKALEDLGYFCADNLPTVLAPEAVDVCLAGGIDRIALGMDVRVRAFLPQVGDMLARIEDGGKRELLVTFLDATDESLLRRFSETRRPHPLSAELPDEQRREGAGGVLEGIEAERERLAPLRARAAFVIDTTELSVHDLRRRMIERFSGGDGSLGMQTRIVSFGFKYGAPVDADLVLDVRFIDNPYFVPDLKELPGTDPRVSAYVLSRPEAVGFRDRTRELLSFVLPRYEREGKSYLTIAIGCTGGKHRSVALAEALSQDLAPIAAHPILVKHRDVDRSRPAQPPSSRTP
jgi:UPF0042 nucleotide-binding protein